MIGEDLKCLFNCDIVHNVAPPPDPKLFPKGMQRIGSAWPGGLELSGWHGCQRRRAEGDGAAGFALGSNTT